MTELQTVRGRGRQSGWQAGGQTKSGPEEESDIVSVREAVTIIFLDTDAI